MDAEVERIWKEFWKDIVTTDGQIDMEQIKKELFDFWVVIQEVSEVYSHITDGMFSKPNTRAEVILEEFQNHFEYITRGG